MPKIQVNYKHKLPNVPGSIPETDSFIHALDEMGTLLHTVKFNSEEVKNAVYWSLSAAEYEEGPLVGTSFQKEFKELYERLERWNEETDWLASKLGGLEVKLKHSKKTAVSYQYKR